MAVYEVVPLAKDEVRATVALPAVRESALSVASVEGVVVEGVVVGPAGTLGWQDARHSTARTARRENFGGDDENLILTSDNNIVIYEDGMHRLMRCQ
jgi:hypothetical protein